MLIFFELMKQIVKHILVCMIWEFGRIRCKITSPVGTYKQSAFVAMRYTHKCANHMQFFSLKVNVRRAQRVSPDPEPINASEPYMRRAQLV